MIARVMAWGLHQTQRLANISHNIREELFQAYCEAPGKPGGQCYYRENGPVVTEFLAVVPLGIRIFSRVSDWTRCGGEPWQGELINPSPMVKNYEGCCDPSPGRIILAILDFVHFVFCAARFLGFAFGRTY